MAEASKAPPAAAAPVEVTKEPAAKMARGTVAKGRTVFAQTSERRIINYDGEGKPIYRFIEKAHRPGQEVELPESEIIHLRKAGFLVDPNAAALNSDVGPTYDKQS